MRITSGSRQSPMMPCAARCSNSARPRSRPPATRSDSWQPRRAGSAGVTICSVSASSRADQRFQIAGELLGLRAQRGHAGALRTSPAKRAAAPAPGSADCSAASRRRRASARTPGPSGSAWPGRGPTSRRSADGRCARGVRARSSRRPRPGRSSGTCSCTRPRNRRRCRAAAAAGCRRHARGRSRRCSRCACARRAIAAGRRPGRCGTARRATAPARCAWPCSASARSIACHRDRAVRLRRGSSSIRSVAGSKPWKRSCDSTA